MEKSTDSNILYTQVDTKTYTFTKIKKKLVIPKVCKIQKLTINFCQVL